MKTTYKLIGIIFGIFFLIVPFAYASLLGPSTGSGQTGLLTPSLIFLSGNYITPSQPQWDFAAPSLAAGCLEIDAQGHFASTGSNCSSGNASTSPGGLTNQVQFNGFGSFVGDSHFTWASSTQLMTIAGSLAVTSATSSTFQNTTVTNATTTNATTTNLVLNNLFLSGTGGSNQVLKQLSSGGIITVGTLASSNLSDSSNIALLNGSQTFSGTVNFGGLTANTLTLGGSSVSLPIATTTASLGGGLLTAGTCASVQATTTQTITTAMAVAVTPTTYPGDGTNWDAYIGPNNTITVKVCALITVTPTSSTYNVRIIP